ncbi:hypothetical protein Marky_2008 [Marinithermus hydrothermalis DSM 14884]|uniref:Uncharacterized protein n=1 Tax=Marinithermus hydrothermalis (strain DSM 14884 / JCM 11576 / T1) TaxID=869210 RepID=F2NMZ7_MARHT|nr:hypothetical protein Marky_2008 [Marinithermus hydrothermalis DSM 14884]
MAPVSCEAEKEVIEREGPHPDSSTDASWRVYASLEVDGRALVLEWRPLQVPETQDAVVRLGGVGGVELAAFEAYWLTLRIRHSEPWGKPGLAWVPPLLVVGLERYTLTPRTAVMLAGALRDLLYEMGYGRDPETNRAF